MHVQQGHCLRCVLAVLLLLAASLPSCSPLAKPPYPPQTETDDLPVTTTGECRILFVGDTSFGENYQTAIEHQGGTNVLRQKGYDYPLEAFGPLLQRSDLVIANLETPITNLTTSPYAASKTYVHWTDVEQAPQCLRRHNIAAVSLANNHTLDYGHEGLWQTLSVLSQNQMDWFGAGLTEQEATRPYIRHFRVGGRLFKLAVIAAFEYHRSYDENYRWYARGGAGGVSRLSLATIGPQIARIKAADPETCVVVFPHWGENYRWKTEEQTALARQLIDAGADMIIGHGAHVMQEIERYRGRWILYSIGNFMFNSPGRFQKLDVRSFSFAAEVVVREQAGRLAKVIRLYPIFTDNLITGYRGRFLTEDEFQEAIGLLCEKAADPSQLRGAIVTGRDDIGLFVELSSEP